MPGDHRNPEALVHTLPILPSGGKAVVVAMDHARAFGVIEGLERPEPVIDAAVDGAPTR